MQQVGINKFLTTTDSESTSNVFNKTKLTINLQKLQSRPIHLFLN